VPKKKLGDSPKQIDSQRALLYQYKLVQFIEGLKMGYLSMQNQS